MKLNFRRSGVWALQKAKDFLASKQSKGVQSVIAILQYLTLNERTSGVFYVG